MVVCFHCQKNKKKMANTPSKRLCQDCFDKMKLRITQAFRGGEVERQEW